MSCTYADGLSHYDDKGILGAPEIFDKDESINIKCSLLAEWIMQAKHVVVHTGAGISTSAGIPDFRGPNGVWTLEQKGLKPTINTSFNEAIPTKTHMALKKLVEEGYVKFIVSQNIDGLHLRSGLPRKYLAELHGNMFTEQCKTCHKQFVRCIASSSVGEKCLDKQCPRGRLNGRNCRGKLYDTILDWEANLPDNDLKLADLQSSIADLNICLGSTLQIVPSGNLPISNNKYGGKLAIINLQPTKHDKKADLIINTYVDTVMEKIMKRLGLEIPEYSPDVDFSRDEDLINDKKVIDWTTVTSNMPDLQKKYDQQWSSYKKRRLEDKKMKEDIKRCKAEIKRDLEAGNSKI